MTSDSQFKIESTKTLHSTQIFTILYILEFHKISQQNQSIVLETKLLQLLTGEGKSIILGILSSFFGFLGYNVDVICYSPYLSNRDEKAFSPLFELLEIQEKIHYSTIDKIFESNINKEYDLRNVTKNMLETGLINISSLQQQDSLDILLIDEVDEFFSPEFIGQTYNPVFLFQTAEIFVICKTIWNFSSLDNQIIYQIIKELEEYKNLMNNYKNLKQILDNEIEKMIIKAKLVASNQIQRQYQVINGKIGYKEQDHLSFTTSYGYETVFSYFLENSKGFVSDHSLNEEIGIIINCGAFSYTELPKRYTKIFGLTGTFESLHSKSKQFLKQYFNEFIKIPSLFLESKLLFDENQNVKVELDKEQYFTAIKAIINQREDRPVMIYFNGTYILEEFIKFMQFSEDEEFKTYVKITQTTQIDTHATNTLDVAINKASHKGIISLIDKSFGRGTDFICDDKDIEKQGGMIAVQTFFSIDKSEEIQIKGRTARQAKSGEYFLVLLADDLVDQLKLSKQEIEEQRKQMQSMYQFLDKKREIQYGTQFELLEQSIEKAYYQQQITQTFSQYLIQGDKNNAFQYLQIINQINQNLHFIFVLDESGSMTKQKENQLKSNWEQVVNSLKEFVKIRQLKNIFQDRMSIIYFGDSARIIAQYEALSINLLAKPSMGATYFIPALEKLQELIENEPYYLKYSKSVVLFLTDGDNQDDEFNLKSKMNQLKEKFGKKIQRWWNIKIGSEQQVSLTQMTEIMKSQNCDAQVYNALYEQNLIEDFQGFANCDKLNF